MRLILGTLALFAFGGAQAQSWCPPGATWTYGTDAFGSYGYQQYTYVGDTTLAGLTGQRLDLHVGMSSFFNDDQDFDHYPTALITGLHDDVVTLWSPDQQAWDTLFWLGAVPGDAFMRPFAEVDPCDPMDRFLIEDTSTVVIDGMSLRRWSVLPLWDGQPGGTTYFTERLGWAWGMIPLPACLIVDGPVGMRCYSDQDISTSFFGFGCTTLVGMEEEPTSRFHVFPNPGSTHFTLGGSDGSLSPAPHTITLFDATGRVVLEQRTAEEQPMIGTENLPAGLYRITIFDDSGLVWGTTWVKQ